MIELKNEGEFPVNLNEDDIFLRCSDVLNVTSQYVIL